MPLIMRLPGLLSRASQAQTLSGDQRSPSPNRVSTGARMTQPALLRLEAGGDVPTIPVLERFAAAFNSDLVVSPQPHAV